MAAPVKETCPDIDKYIKYIKMCICKDRDLKNMEEKELYEAASEMNTQLESCIDYLEELRSSNHSLREWGKELESEVEFAAIQIDELEKQIESLHPITTP